MQVAITVPQDQLQAAVRAEVGAIFAGLLGSKPAPSAPARRAPAPAQKAAAAPAPARKRAQSTAAPKAAEVAGPAKPGGIKEGTNAATVLAAVKQGLSRADEIAEKTKLDKGQVNAGLAVLKRNGLIAATGRGQYKAN